MSEERLTDHTDSCAYVERGGLRDCTCGYGAEARLGSASQAKREGHVTVPAGAEDVSLVETEKTFVVRLKDTAEIFLMARKRSDGSTLVRAQHTAGDAGHFVNAPLAVLKALVAVVEANQ